MRNKDQEAGPNTTKRIILHEVAKAFDRMGMSSPILVSGRIKLQELWKEEFGWDDPISPIKSQEWQTTLNDIRLCSKMKIQRWVVDKTLPVDLLCFTDASSQAYATTVYARQEDPAGKVTCHLIYSKSRVAPIKPNHTIPRLELLGVLIGVRSLNFTEKELDVPVRIKTLWTDSQIVLHWISSKKKLEVFVQNRVKEIQEKGTDIEFKYVSTSCNPADLATRGMNYSSLEESCWFNGPEWVLNNEQTWPTWTKEPGGLPINPMMVELPSKEVHPPYSIDISRVLSLQKLLRVTAYCKRFIERIQKFYHY
jgi:hypothetical protein